jgi:hypothetical protein
MQRFLVSILVLVAACAGDSSSQSKANNNCAQDVVPMPATAVCAAATKTCLDACPETDENCPDNCMTADPDAESCSTCLGDAYTACVNTAGCQATYDALQCCVNGCADPDSDDCYTTTCQKESTAYDSCAEMHDGACSDTVCFKM